MTSNSTEQPEMVTNSGAIFREKWGWRFRLFVAAATVLVSLAVATPAFAWPMCGY